MPTPAGMRLARQAAERTMLSTCTIDRPGTPTEGPGGVLSPSFSTVYAGKCRIASGVAHGETATIGEAARVITHTVLWLPVDAPDVREGDRVTITNATLSPNLIGKVFTVRAVARSSTPIKTVVELIEVNS